MPCLLLLDADFGCPQRSFTELRDTPQRSLCRDPCKTMRDSTAPVGVQPLMLWPRPFVFVLTKFVNIGTRFQRQKLEKVSKLGEGMRSFPECVDSVLHRTELY